MSRTIELEQLRVASPCHADWDAMRGDDRARFCGECSKHVYDLSGMTRDEAHDLIAQHEGRLCIRMHRRHDGTVITQDCPVGVRAAARRAWLKVAAGVALLVTLGTGGTAVASQVRSDTREAARVSVCPPAVKSGFEQIRLLVLSLERRRAVPGPIMGDIAIQNPAEMGKMMPVDE